MSFPTPDQNQRALLAEALQLSRSLLNSSSNLGEKSIQQRQNRLRQIRDALKVFAHPIQRDLLSVDQMPLAVRQAFVKAALLVTRYAQVGGNQWQGTIASPTLGNYQPDPIPSHWLSEQAINPLCRGFALPEGSEIDLEERLQAVDRHIAQQRQIIVAVLGERDGKEDREGRDAENLLPEIANLRSKALALFHHLFGDVPIPVGAIDLIYTEMQIFFCIDYQDGQLRDPALWNQLTEAEKSLVREFLESLKQFNFELFDRFPIFGPCLPQRLDYPWCNGLAAATGLSTPDIIQALIRAVGIVPTQKAEAFLVHDIWGHHWQLMLTQFESDYGILTTCGEGLRAGETAYTNDGPLSCRELFDLETDEVRLDTDKARLFFHGEVRQRLGLLFTHLIGEMIADVAEFKFVWECPDAADQLLSSSLFKSEPTKLDLSLADVDFLFLRVLKPLLEIHLSALEESGLEAELLADWAKNGKAVDSLELRTSLKQAIVHLYQIFLQEYNRFYLPTLGGETGLFTQIVSNLLYLQNAINSLYTDRTPKAYAGLPFQDLLIVFIGCYCSSDSYAEFWAIDDVLAGYFLPCWHHLRSIATPLDGF
ncbi:MAG: hypothetical protein WCA35_09765 [Kovacikia sp.]